MRSVRVSILLCTIFSLSTLPVFPAQAEEPLKIAFIDALSGPFAQVGQNALAGFQFAVDEVVNNNGGVLDGRKIEIIEFDDRGSALTAQRRLREAQAAGARFLIQGSSSHVANALVRAIDRKNSEDPENTILFLDYAANDPALTNKNCSFWHFRFDVNAEMKVAALVRSIASNPEIKSVYIIGQDYSLGHAVSEDAKSFLKRANPNIKVVGDVLHPVGMVEDFSMYVEAITKARPDAIITGNWGVDVNRLTDAIFTAGLDVPIYSLYGNFDDPRGAGKVHLAHGGVGGETPQRLVDMTKRFAARFPEANLAQRQIITTIEYLARAMEKAGTDDPKAVAAAMEAMQFETVTGSTVQMRAKDHQLIEPIHVSVQDNNVINILTGEKGPGLRVIDTMPGDEAASLPTSCMMTRPAGI